MGVAGVLRQAEGPRGNDGRGTQPVRSHDGEVFDAIYTLALTSPATRKIPQQRQGAPYVHYTPSVCSRRRGCGRVARHADVGSASGFWSHDDIRVAVVGCGVRGGVHIDAFGRQKGVRLAAVCDPDRQRLQLAAKSIENRFGYKPEPVVDVRRLMDRNDIDVVSVATMQYWHALPTIWACQTGRHVYVEKPLAHFIWEGRQMVNAARKYDRLVKSVSNRAPASVFRRRSSISGRAKLGKIQYIVAFANKGRHSIGRRSEPLPIPDTLD